jgi:membrane protein required for colicin V production
MIPDFTLLDVVVVLAIILSTIYAAIRGFVHETLSVFAWAAAAFATLYFAPAVAPFLRARMPSPFVGTLVAYAGIFLVVLVPLSFISYRFSENVKDSAVGAVDRVLGVVFGVTRGLAIVGIAYIVFSLFVPIRMHPHWIRDAQLLPLVRESSEVILTLVPNQNFNMVDDSIRRHDPLGHDPDAKDGRKTANDKRGHKSYGADDRRALDNLIETTGSGNGKP